MKARAFITGSTGFVGSRLAQRLIEMGLEVHISIRSSSDLWRLQSFQSQLHLHELDLLNFKNVSQLLNQIKPDYVFHSACYGGFPDENVTSKILQTNILSTEFLLDSCTKLAIKKFIYIGSSSEYGHHSYPMIEESETNPNSIYAISKLTGTLLTQWYAKEKNLPSTVLRIFSPYGSFDSPKRLIPQVIQACIEKTPLLLGSGKQVRDYIYIEDLIDAFLLCLDNSTVVGEIINLGSGKQHSVLESVNTILEILNHPIKPQWNYYPDRKHEPTTWISDITKAKTLLNWFPKTSFITGLKATIAWTTKRRKIYESI